jgi:hypothetical protein
MTFSEVTSLIMALVALGGFVVLWRKYNPEVRQMNSASMKAVSEARNADAAAAKEYSDLLHDALKESNELKDQYEARIGTLEARQVENKKLYEARITDLEGKYTELEDQLRTEKQRRKQFEDWAQRLAYQVQSMGGTPVKFGSGPLDPSVAK